MSNKNHKQISEKVRLEISRCIAPDNLWFWAVRFDSGHIFVVSEESYESAEICAASAGTLGLAALYAAERAAKNLPPFPTSAASSLVFEPSKAGLPVSSKAENIVASNVSDPSEAGNVEKYPAFDCDGDPTDGTLAEIENWQPDFKAVNPWSSLIKYVKEACYGAVREEQDEDGKTLLCFVTGGWSSNEAVQGAMSRNIMFNAMCWHSSYRGGLVKYFGNIL